MIEYLQAAEQSARDASDATTSLRLFNISLDELGFIIRGRVQFDGDVYQAVHIVSWLDFRQQPKSLSTGVAIVVRKLENIAFAQGHKK